MDPSRQSFVSSNNSKRSVNEHFTQHGMELGNRLSTEDFNEFNEHQNELPNTHEHKYKLPNIHSYDNNVGFMSEVNDKSDQNEHKNDLVSDLDNDQHYKINYGYIDDQDDKVINDKSINKSTNEHTNGFVKVIDNTYTNQSFIDGLSNETNNNSIRKSEFDDELPIDKPKNLSKKLEKPNSAKLEESEVQKHVEDKGETEAGVIKDSGYAWVVVGAMFVSNILTTGYLKGFGVVYNEILEQYPSASGTMAGIMMSLLSGFRSLCAPLAGTMANYIGVRKTMCFGAFLYSSALFSSYFCSSLLQLSITLGAMIGLSHCIIESCQVVVISQYFEAKLSKANGIRVAGSPCGGILYPLLLTLLLQHYGLHLTFLFLAGITLNIFICAFLMKPVTLHKAIVVDKVKRLFKEDSSKEDGLSFQSGGFLHRNSVLDNHLDIIHANEVKGISYRSNNDMKIVSGNTDRIEYLNKENVLNCNRFQQNIYEDINKDRANKIYMYDQSISKQHNSSVGDHISCIEKQGQQSLTDDQPIIQQLNPSESQKSSSEKAKKKLDFRFLKDPQYLLFVFMAAGIPMGLPLVLYYTTIYAKNVAGLTPYEVTILLSYQAVLDFCLRIFIGWVNNKNLYKKSNGFVVCLWLSALGSVFMTFGNNSLLYLIGAISLYTFGPASYHTFVNVILTETFGKQNIASTWGFVRMTQGAFSFLHPTLIGYLVDRTGAYTVPFLVMGGGMFLCGVIIFAGRFFGGNSLKPSKEEDIQKKESH